MGQTSEVYTDKDVQELVPPGAPLPDDGNPDLPVAPVSDEPQIKCGYVIGVREDGEFVFEILGTNPGLIELLGLHTIVRERLQARMDKQLKGKTSLLLSRLDDLTKLIQGGLETQ